MNYQFAQILHAWKTKNPTLVDMLVALTQQPDPEPISPIPDDELTFERFLQKIFSNEFRQKHPDVQFAERVAMIAKLEADEGVYPLPERYKIHILLTMLWEDKSPYAQSVLLSAIDALPLCYGVWKGLKYIFKQAEAQHDYEVFARITAKIDYERYNHNIRSTVSLPTKTYMVLRAWRFLRKIGEQAGLLYPEIALQVLACYPKELNLHSYEFYQSWVLNHICFHNKVSYGVNTFGYFRKTKLFDAKGRAFAETWQRDPEPLLRLLMIARSELVRQFATDSLKHDFSTQLRHVSVSILQHLSAISEPSNARDELLVWLLHHSSNLQQSQFKALGLHDVVLKLLYSNFSMAYQYAIDYANNYAKDLAVEQLLFLAISQHENIRQFAIQQLLSNNPRKLGIDVWGQLLDSQYHHVIAEKQLQQHFTRRDLSSDWFYQRLLSENKYSSDFAIKYLLSLYTIDELGVDYFVNLAQHISDNVSVMKFALNCLKNIGLSQVPVILWQQLLLNKLANKQIIQWIQDDVIHANHLPIDYWHALAYQPDWDKNDWIQNFRIFHQEQTDCWNLSFNDNLAKQVLEWLADVRRFSPPSLGFDWLMTLAKSDDDTIRQFAIDRINKGFIPADFAPVNQLNSYSTNHTPIDFNQQSFLFTGKLTSMTRGEAENLVKHANGKISGSVNAKLNFLVIGDDGSPLYGNGRKGSKQIKAEDLISAGATIKIISETAFLQMLLGQSRKSNEQQNLMGAEVLWQMAIENPDSAISELAITYLTHHHEQLCLALTDRPVDPNAIIPHHFFNAERVIPILKSGHTHLRQFALQLLEFELNHWQLTAEQWKILAEINHQDVQSLLHHALLDEVNNNNRRYHQDVQKLSAEMLSTLLDSRQRFARQLGITLLKRYPQFQQAELLYYLTESTDRELRYVAVKMLWQHYRYQRVSSNWQAKIDNQSQSMISRSDVLPINIEQLLLLLKRGLFELPPARLPKVTTTQMDNQPKLQPQQEKSSTSFKMMKSMSASQAKIALIETFRDVALQDCDFAQWVLPLLQQFTVSTGKMERHACLVAVTRILHTYPHLASAS